MAKYFANIYETVNTLWTGMRITWRHMINIKRDNVTLQYPEERWPRPERNTLKAAPTWPVPPTTTTRGRQPTSPLIVGSTPGRGTDADTS